MTTANGTATYDSGAVSQNFAAAANLDIKNRDCRKRLHNGPAKRQR